MINVYLYYDQKKQSLRGIELCGHAEYDEYGYDIVCSAVTSNVISVINSFEYILNYKFEELIAEEGHIKFLLKDNSTEKSDLLMNHLRLSLREISKEYPNIIKIYEK